MKLHTLLQAWLTLKMPALADRDILGLSNDSRTIEPGFLFIAYKGESGDGRAYMQEALDAGASAIVYDPLDWDIKPSLMPFSLPFENLQVHLAAIAKRFYQQASKSMQILGVTGTNGKTTIAYQLASAHALLGQKSAYIGTLGQGKVEDLKPLANTTPDALCLQALFYQYQLENTQQIAMEVSSHALAQNRVQYIDFQQAIFTNLTLDHLDYHQTMQAYAKAKALLFATPSLEWAIINTDDPYASLMIEALPSSCKCLRYGIKKASDVQALNWELGLQGTKIKLRSPWGESSFSIQGLGFFNIYNALAIFSSLMAAGYGLQEVTHLLPKLKQAPGRMELVHKKPYIFIDYAHTPDALENVLKTLSTLKKNKLILVFGCGGNRDKSKRPLMGALALAYADIVIVTSDNPRHEDAHQIIEDIKKGMPHVHKGVYFLPYREEAIAKAIGLADENDSILIAGKGHESYQQIGDIRYPFSDQTVVKRLSTPA